MPDQYWVTLQEGDGLARPNTGPGQDTMKP